jgi:hypothetical protein
MAMQVVKTIHDQGNERKVQVFQREDGTFGFEEWKWSREENCWMPLPKQITSVIDTLEHAQEEAKERIPWLRTKGAQ